MSILNKPGRRQITAFPVCFFLFAPGGGKAETTKRQGDKEMKKRLKQWVSILLACLLPLTAAGCGTKDKNKGESEMETWISQEVAFKRKTLQVYLLSGQETKLEQYASLIEAADLSTVSDDPSAKKSNGLIRPGDLIVCSHNMLLWFDMTYDHLRTTNGGGGLLRGMWPLVENDGIPAFDLQEEGTLASNLFAAGCKPGQQGSGISFLGNYGKKNVDNGFGLAIEHDSNPQLTEQTGTMVPDGDYAGGLIVQVHGLLANSSLSEDALTAHGLDSRYDVDTRPNVEGRAAYTTTYCIAPHGWKWRQEIDVEVIQNQFGALATLVISNNVAGYENEELVYAGSPLLAGKDAKDNTDAGVLPLGDKEVRLYSHPWRATQGQIRWVETPDGTGRAAGIGLKSGRKPMLLVQLDKETLPPVFRPSYRIMTIDNQGISEDRYNCLDIAYFDVNSGDTSKIFKEGDTLHFALDYSFIFPSL